MQRVRPNRQFNNRARVVNVLPDLGTVEEPKQGFVYEGTNDYRIRVHRCEQGVMAFCRKEGFSYECTLLEVPARSSHWEDALNREVMVANVLRDIGRRNRTACVLDYFGSKRTVSIAARVNLLFQLDLVIRLYRPKIVDEDIFRAAENHDEEEETQDVDAVLFIDIYISELEFSQYWLDLPTFIIFHHHRGFMGCQGFKGCWIEKPMGSNQLLISSDSDGVVNYRHEREWYLESSIYCSRVVAEKQCYYGIELAKRTEPFSILTFRDRNYCELTNRESFQLFWQTGIYRSSLVFDNNIVNEIVQSQGFRLVKDKCTYVTLYKMVSDRIMQKYKCVESLDCCSDVTELVLNSTLCACVRIRQQGLIQEWMSSSLGYSWWSLTEVLLSCVFGRVRWDLLLNPWTILILVCTCFGSVLLVWLLYTWGWWSNFSFRFGELYFLAWYFRKYPSVFWVPIVWGFIILLFSSWYYVVCNPPSFGEALRRNDYIWQHSDAVYKGGVVLRIDHVTLAEKELKPFDLLKVGGNLARSGHWFASPDFGKRGMDRWYAYFGLAFPGKVYVDSASVRLAAFRRLMLRPLLTPVEQSFNWRLVFRFWGRLLNNMVMTLQEVRHDVIVILLEQLKNWISTKTSKQKLMYQRVLDDLSYLTNETVAVPVLAKVDEIITKDPRAIFNVGPRIQVFAGPYIDEAFDRFKNSFNENQVYSYVHDGQRFYYSLAVGSGRNDAQLGEWANVVEHCRYRNSIHILAAGDDVIFRLCRNGVVCYGCSDFSKYDQSQSFHRTSDEDDYGGPIGFSFMVLQWCGLPKDVYWRCFSCMRRAACTTIKEGLLRKTFLSYDSKSWPMLATGVPWTTASNTIVTLFSSLYVFYAYVFGNHDSIVNTMAMGFRFLGLDAKIKRFDRLSQCDFLKGHFLQSINGLVWRWAPGLGVVSKIGLSKKDVRTEMAYHKKSSSDAILAYISDVCEGWRFHVQVPILRIFCRRFTSVCRGAVYVNDYAPLGSGGNVRFSDYDFTDYLAYYDVTEEELEELEKKLENLAVGNILDSSLLPKILKDYL
jgi:hypothetical protein